MNSLWQRFQKYFLRYSEIGFTIDISRMRFADDFLQSMGARAQRAFSEMRQLEAGGIANVDERRMVGHYWLRNPGLAPTASLRNDIEETNARIKSLLLRSMPVISRRRRGNSAIFWSSASAARRSARNLSPTPLETPATQWTHSSLIIPIRMVSIECGEN